MSTVSFFFRTHWVIFLGKRREAEEISRIKEAMAKVIAKTEEYKKELTTKKKQLEEMYAELDP